jgi:putative endonuclease
MMTLLYRAADALRDRARRRALPVEAAHGRRGEDLAHRYLRGHGFTVVARNYRPPSGGAEIDLIGWDGDTLAFVEVKTRLDDEFGSPESAVDAEKREFIRRAARDYARRTGIEWDRVRFDVVNVYLGGKPRLELCKDAFHPERTL